LPILGIFAFAVLVTEAWGQDPPVTTPPVTIESAQSLYDQAQKTADYAEPVKAQLVRILGGAVEHLKSAAEFDAQIKAYDSALTDGEAQAQALQKELDLPAQSAKVDVTEQSSLPQLMQQLAQAESTLAVARAEMAALEEESAGRDERRKQLPGALDQAKQDLANPAQMEAPAETWFIPQMAEARALFEEARKVCLKSQAAALEKELNSYDIRGKLLQLRMDRAVQNISVQEQLVQELRALVAEKRKKDAIAAAQQARDAVLDAAQATPELRQIAQQLAAENQALVELRTGPEGLLAKMEQASKAQEDVEAQLEQVKANYTAATQKVNAGLNAGVGLLLRRQKDQLPNVRQLRRDIRKWQDEIADVQVKRIEYGEQRMAVAQADKAMEPYRARIPASLTAQQRSKLEGLIKTLLQAKRESLESLLHDYDTYFGSLVNLDDRTRVLEKETANFATYINERILWVRSDSPIGWVDFEVAPAAVRRLLAPARLAQIPTTLLNEWRSMYALDFFILLALAALLWLYRRIAAGLSSVSKEADMPAGLSLRPTTNAVLGTFLLALPAPILFWLIGWRLYSAVNGAEFVRAFGGALREGAYLLLVFETARQCLRPRGLFEFHFKWPRAPLRTIRRHLSWFMLVATLSFFMLTFLDGLEGEIGTEPLARFTFLFASAAGVIFADRLLRPAGPVAMIAGLPDMPRRRWWYRVGYAAIIAGFMALMFLSASGYLYTALQLIRRLSQTLILFFLLVLVRGFVMRWLLLARRRLALHQIRMKREAQKERDPKSDPPAQELSFDIDLIDQQTTRLLNGLIAAALVVGAFLIWAEELPALSILREYKVWGTANLTLANMAVAILAATLTLIAAANVPGLIELTVLHRMKLVKGERYAITTIIRYLIAIAGSVVTLNMIGIDWSSVQWLVAALGVGLGFGLQEIFANFISGLIILLEQPIRVGDTVTVGGLTGTTGGLTGTVSRIRIRATSITDFDNKELIVPNKEFVTSKVLNWTLNDSLLRLVFPVGILGGTDVQTAQKLLYELAKSNPSVLRHPQPQVLVTGFGDNVLMLELRIYCSGIESVVGLKNDMNLGIERLFRENNIQYRAAKETPESYPGKI
jgi:potassium efflux system protein